MGPPDLVAGPDGLLRCWWAGTGPEMARYHDEEWGRGPRDEESLFERLSLEALQAGLSWRIVLERRESLRGAFSGFSPSLLAKLPQGAVEGILASPGTIRNRAKTTAILHNAAVLVRLHAGGSGLRAITEEVLAAQGPGGAPAPRRRSDVPASTATSAALALRLRRAGWRFIGPTTAYAYLQAVGWIDDHLLGCHARRAPDPARALR